MIRGDTAGFYVTTFIGMVLASSVILGLLFAPCCLGLVFIPLGAYNPSAVSYGAFLASFWIPVIAIAAVDLLLFVLVVFYYRSQGDSLRAELISVCEGASSGVANITILYIYPLLAVAYFKAVAKTLVGILRRKPRSQV
jgi:hypothetical protein